MNITAEYYLYEANYQRPWQFAVLLHFEFSSFWNAGIEAFLNRRFTVEAPPSGSRACLVCTLSCDLIGLHEICWSAHFFAKDEIQDKLTCASQWAPFSIPRSWDRSFATVLIGNLRLYVGTEVIRAAPKEDWVSKSFVLMLPFVISLTGVEDGHDVNCTVHTMLLCLMACFM